MRRVIGVIALILVVMSLCTALMACGVNTNGLVYNKKYISELSVSNPENEQIYFIIMRDGTAKYHYYDKNVRPYTINCKWTTIDDTSIVLSFDSVEYDDEDEVHYTRALNNFVLTLSRNVILSVREPRIFYNEDYLKNEIKNFGKPANQ